MYAYKDKPSKEESLFEETYHLLNQSKPKIHIFEEFKIDTDGDIRSIFTALKVHSNSQALYNIGSIIFLIKISLDSKYAKYFIPIAKAIIVDIHKRSRISCDVDQFLIPSDDLRYIITFTVSCIIHKICNTDEFHSYMTFINACLLLLSDKTITQQTVQHLISELENKTDFITNSGIFSEIFTISNNLKLKLEPSPKIIEMIQHLRFLHATEIETAFLCKGFNSFRDSSVYDWCTECSKEFVIKFIEHYSIKTHVLCFITQMLRHLESEDLKYINNLTNIFSVTLILVSRYYSESVFQLAGILCSDDSFFQTILHRIIMNLNGEDNDFTDLYGKLLFYIPIERMAWACAFSDWEVAKQIILAIEEASVIDKISFKKIIEQFINEEKRIDFANWFEDIFDNLG